MLIPLLIKKKKRFSRLDAILVNALYQAARTQSAIPAGGRSPWLLNNEIEHLIYVSVGRNIKSLIRNRLRAQYA